MIPYLVTVGCRRPDGRRWRLYIPVLLVLLVLSPLLLLAVLGGVVACLVTGVSPVGALRGAGQLLWALPGTRFELEYDRTAVQVSVR
ncbi:hypothetical protein P2Q00_07320 [Streptomyces coacervatus]|uniref:hypothetical protein n=1 Tax=Streptomyces coacervatus TaxID=647381 RepID=UPI0023DCC355|nr:hypothetical protein [Streptomyces coacervatus]MDF2265251.1 hypothetical protein [Streptomyces coacervatus]